MNIEHRLDGPDIYARFSGVSGFSDYQQVAELCQLMNVSTPRCTCLEVDMSALDFIDSSGLGLLLLLKEHCDRQHVRLTLRHAHGQVRRMLETSRLNEKFGLPYQDA